MATQKPNYQPWNHDEFLADLCVRRMNEVQRWMYCFLLHSSFFHGTRPYLPISDDDLWVLAGCKDKKQWIDNKAPVLACFDEVASSDEKYLLQKRVAREYEKLDGARRKASEWGKQGNEARWGATRQAIGTQSAPDQPPVGSDRRVRDRVRDREELENTKVKSSVEAQTASTVVSPAASSPSKKKKPEGPEPFDVPTEVRLCEILDKLFAYYLRRLNKNPNVYTLTDLRRRKGMARLRECLIKARRELKGDEAFQKAGRLMKLAIDRIAESEFHMGKNERNKRYVDWEKNLFASAQQLERWLDEGI
jgi:hypothetical protein